MFTNKNMCGKYFNTWTLKIFLMWQNVNALIKKYELICAYFTLFLFYLE